MTAKDRLAFVCMALGIPAVHWTLAVIAAVVLFLLCCGCSSEEVIDRINGLPSDDAINQRYSHVSASAPESLKPFYDPELTQALNRSEP